MPPPLSLLLEPLGVHVKDVFVRMVFLGLGIGLERLMVSIVSEKNS